MLISLTTLLATLSSLFRSRVALELENLALRHQIGVLQRSARKRPRLTPVDRLLGLAVPDLGRLALGISHRQARNGRGLAWLPVFGCSGPGRCGAANPDDLPFAREVRDLIREMCGENSPRR
jgi:hypothetical protein